MPLKKHTRAFIAAENLRRVHPVAGENKLISVKSAETAANPANPAIHGWKPFMMDR